MNTRRLRAIFVATALVALVSSTVGRAAAQSDGVNLLHEMPEGVAFETLATGQGQTFRFHTDALYLHRIDIACGQVTGKIFGMEQITYVEYGQVDVRDWDTGEVVTTLSAGDSYGPTEDETSFFLAFPTGKNASVLHFSAVASGQIGDELPDISYESTDCGSGAITSMVAESAVVSELLGSEFDDVDILPGSDLTFYVGLLTVEPGASVGQPYASGADVDRYFSTGSGVILTTMGGFGDGSAGMAGISAGPEIGPEQTAWMYPEGGVALENFGASPATALLFGVLSTGAPIFTLQHT